MELTEEALIKLQHLLDSPCNACNGNGEIASDQPCIECCGWGVSMPLAIHDAVPALIAEVRRLRAENDHLMQCVEAHADEARRRLEQIEVLRDDRERLQQAAERDALARLEAWRKAGSDRNGTVSWVTRTNRSLVRLESAGECVLALTTDEDRAGVRSINGSMTICNVGACNDSLAALIHAALDEWERRYGEKEEAAS